MAKVTQRGTTVVILDDNDNEVLTIGADGKLSTGDYVAVVNADTSGAALGALETEVNELKAVLRATGLVG
jgi:hypothetical protein